MNRPIFNSIAWVTTVVMTVLNNDFILYVEERGIFRLEAPETQEEV